MAKKAFFIIIVLITIQAMIACGKSNDSGSATSDGSKSQENSEFTTIASEAETQTETMPVETITETESLEIDDINDYLVTVDLTADNFDEYFEFVTEPQYTSFGELQGEAISYGLRSKKYDDGLVLYTDDNIIIEYNLFDQDAQENQISQCGFEQLLYFGQGFGNDAKLEYLRNTEGTVVFLKKEYIANYSIETNKDKYGEAKILLRNGEEIIRGIYEGYPY